MKKKAILGIVLFLAALAILTIPIPTGGCEDDETRSYTALTYKIVHWNREMVNTAAEIETYSATRVYPFPQNFASLERLWEKESARIAREKNTDNAFLATIIQCDGGTVIVEPFADEWERRSADRIAFSMPYANANYYLPGCTVEIVYDGEIAETYPAQIQLISMRPAGAWRDLTYDGTWMDLETAERWDAPYEIDAVINAIYTDCFFVSYVIPMPYLVRVKGTLDAKWCVGDQVHLLADEIFFQDGRVECTLQSVEESDFVLDTAVAYKPVIYLYPETDTEVTVKLTLNGALTCTYPAYRDGWTVTAHPDGTLTDAAGTAYNYLYWEGKLAAAYDFSSGFCVRGEDTAAFLEWALAQLGLTRREANEFIVYWLPQMQQNAYNLISFQTKAYTDTAHLTVSPEPDTVIRVFMAYRALDEKVEILPQDLTAPERRGFTVVEWGGSAVS